MFSVWAPHASSVTLLIYTPPPGAPGAADHHDAAVPALATIPAEHFTSYPMQPAPARAGWFITDPSDETIPTAESTLYAFRLDDGPALPDPRSRRQPFGIHGLSQVWGGTSALPLPRALNDAPIPVSAEVSAEAAQDSRCAADRLRGQVLYELHIGTFTPVGTLTSAIERLQDLKDLGVTAVELMPIQPFGGHRNWGYDGVFWHAVSESYGGPDALREFVTAAHQLDLLVILDVVYNHFGPDGNYTGAFGPYTAGGSTGWGEVVNLQGPGSDEVRQYILDAVAHWTDTFGIDGLRLDAIHALNDVGATSIIEQIRDVAAASGAFVIAESDHNDPKYTEVYKIAQWNDDVHHAIHTAVSGENHAYYADFGSAEVLATTLERVFWHDGRFSTFRGRTHGRPLAAAGQRDYWRFVVYTTTHDQTGNRASGDRPSMNLSVEQQLAKAALVLLSPYTPMLFMGEEWGASTPFAFFVDHESEELNAATRAGRLREFARAGWDPAEVPDPAAVETFTASQLRWEEREEPSHARVLAGYRELLETRRELRLAESTVDSVRWGDGESPWVQARYAVPGGDASATSQIVQLTVNLSDQPLAFAAIAASGEAEAPGASSAAGASGTTDTRELGPWGYDVRVIAR